MLFVVRFTDRPDSLPLRQALLSAHLDWLRQHEQAVLVAGSLRPEADAAPVGACWIVEAQDKPAVEALIETDPFWSGGLRADREILHWVKAFPDRRTTV